MSDSVPQLSKILIQTVEYIADGKTKQEIADILGLKYNTVMKRVRMCREQTGTVNNASLVAYCLRNGLIK